MLPHARARHTACVVVTVVTVVTVVVVVVVGRVFAPESTARRRLRQARSGGWGQGLGVVLVGVWGYAV